MTKNNKLPLLAIMIPCFNEAEVIPATIEILLNVIKNLTSKQKISPNSFIYLIDDGSEDNTWEIIQNHSKTYHSIKALKLSRNFGQQNALYAGFMALKEKTDCVISIDADLQDSISCIEEFIGKYHQGYEIVYGVRKRRHYDGWFKKISAKIFYKLMKLLGTDIIPDHSDFRLISNRVINNLEKFSEFNLFLRGVITLIGFKSCNIYYDRGYRIAGQSKYPIKKLLAYSVDGITAFSVAPLRLTALFGCLFFLICLLLCIYFAISKFMLHEALPNWLKTVLPIYFIGSIQLLTLGIIGEYLSKVYQEIKARPRFIIDEEII